MTWPGMTVEHAAPTGGDAGVAGGGRRRVRDLWVAGRGPVLVFGFSLLLSVVTYLLATNKVLNYLEQREAVNLALQVAVSVGVLIVVIGADAISGERERGTLERCC